MTKTSDLKQLVDNLVALNDDDLAQRVRADSDVQWCLSELQDILAADVAPVVGACISQSSFLFFGGVGTRHPYQNR